MGEMEERIGAILNDPNMMQQIMSMAQSLAQNVPAQEPAQKEPSQGNTGMNFDPAMIQKIASLAGKANIDKDQHSLLQALRPYLSAGRISKLEKAMRAAKMARMAGLTIGGR